MTNAANKEESTSSIIKDVTLMWVHLEKPVSPFGDEVYDLRIDVPKKRIKELEQYGKPKVVMLDGAPTGMVSINLKKKAFLKDGGPAKKVRVVDANKAPMTDLGSIGNGSKGNVMVIQRPFEIKAPNGKVTKSGTATMLIAVQVTDLKKYEPTSSMDFDSAGGDDNDENGKDDDQF